MKDNKNTIDGMILGVSLFLAIVFLGAWMFILTQPVTTMAQLYNNTSLVNTTVNITNSAPLVYAIALDTPVDLIAYSNKTVFCNLTTFDFDNDTLSVNATLYLDGVALPGAQNDGNYHYSNSTCQPTSPQDRLMNYTCAFQVLYYADNSSNWYCNATVMDTGSAFSSNRSNSGVINPLVAIKMDSLLDYGDLAVNEISNDTLANITNAGNRNASISVEGYGQTPGDTFAFVCDFGTIPLQYERYNITNSSLQAAYTDMTQLTGSTTLIPNFYVPHRTNENYDSQNATFWRVQIPVGAGGVCNGKILFTASDSGN